MALNPDDLLIFKEREEKEAAKKEKSAPKPTKAPKEKAAVPKPAPTPKTAPQPSAAPQSGTLPQAKIESVPEAAALPKEARPKQQPAEKPMQEEKAEAQRPAASQQRAQPGARTPAVENIYASLQPSDEEIEAIMSGELISSGGGPAKRAPISRSESQSRDAAKGLSCVWHPWRPAYALCNYCNRPFCYEDLVEYKNNYYCLEDIDKVSAGKETETTVRYNRLSMLSALLFVALFVAFLYLDGGQVAYVTHYANSVGFFTFLSGINYAYGYPILGFLLSLFSIISGILIFARSDKGFLMGSLTGAFAALLFSYSYIASGTLYTILLSLVSFFALVTLLLSRESYETEETSVPVGSYQQAGLPAGRF